MVTKNKKTRNALKIVDRMAGKDKKLRALMTEARINAEVAQLIFEARTKAALTQKQLANMINTTQSVIARLEDADYEGHSLSMLQKIAHVLDHQLKIDLVPNKRVA